MILIFYSHIYPLSVLCLQCAVAVLYDHCDFYPLHLFLQRGLKATELNNNNIDIHVIITKLFQSYTVCTTQIIYRRKPCNAVTQYAPRTLEENTKEEIQKSMADLLSFMDKVTPRYYYQRLYCRMCWLFLECSVPREKYLIFAIPFDCEIITRCTCTVFYTPWYSFTNPYPLISLHLFVDLSIHTPT